MDEKKQNTLKSKSELKGCGVGFNEITGDDDNYSYCGQEICGEILLCDKCEGKYEEKSKSEQKVEAHTEVSMDAYDKGVEVGKAISKADQIKHELDKDYDICENCWHKSNCGEEGKKKHKKRCERFESKCVKTKQEVKNEN